LSLYQSKGLTLFLAKQTKKEKTMKKRKVEIFTAGCPICEPALQRIKELACEQCEIIVHDLHEGCETDECRTKAYGVTRVPAVAVEGSLLDCCQGVALSEDVLKEAGIGIS